MNKINLFFLESIENGIRIRENGKSGTLAARARNDESCGQMVQIQNTQTKIRRLTPLECKRLQTVSDDYKMDIVSETQQYKMIGNGWTISVIAHIFKHIQL